MRLALTNFACLDCLKVFKRPANASRRVCPHCRGEARRVGSDFKAPQRGDAGAWEVASFLIRAGFPYYRIGVSYPSTLKDAEAFVRINAAKAVAE